MKKKDAELEAMKITLTEANNALSKALDDIVAVEKKQKLTEAKLMTLKDNVRRFVSNVFGKPVRVSLSLVIWFFPLLTCILFC